MICVMIMLYESIEIVERKNVGDYWLLIGNEFYIS